MIAPAKVSQIQSATTFKDLITAIGDGSELKSIGTDDDLRAAKDAFIIKLINAMFRLQTSYASYSGPRLDKIATSMFKGYIAAANAAGSVQNVSDLGDASELETTVSEAVEEDFGEVTKILNSLRALSGSSDIIKGLDPDSSKTNAIGTATDPGTIDFYDAYSHIETWKLKIVAALKETMETAFGEIGSVSTIASDLRTSFEVYAKSKIFEDQSASGKYYAKLAEIHSVVDKQMGTDSAAIWTAARKNCGGDALAATATPIPKNYSDLVAGIMKATGADCNVLNVPENLTKAIDHNRSGKPNIQALNAHGVLKILQRHPYALYAMTNQNIDDLNDLIKQRVPIFAPRETHSKLNDNISTSGVAGVMTSMWTLERKIEGSRGIFPVNSEYKPPEIKVPEREIPDLPVTGDGGGGTAV